MTTMNVQDRPEAFGVFKPVGHVIVSFPPDADMTAAADALEQSGFSADQVLRYTPQQMKQQAEIDIAKATPLASLGQELNLVKAHLELAEQGHSFLVVHAPKDEDARRVASVALRFNAARAQQYGRFVIEELIEPGDGSKQVAESPDRGLDAQTRSGVEGELNPR